jgi:hypothetical protein
MLLLPPALHSPCQKLDDLIHECVHLHIVFVKQSSEVVVYRREERVVYCGGVAAPPRHSVSMRHERQPPNILERHLFSIDITNHLRPRRLYA